MRRVYPSGTEKPGKLHTGIFQDKPYRTRGGINEVQAGSLAHPERHEWWDCSPCALPAPPHADPILGIRAVWPPLQLGTACSPRPFNQKNPSGSEPAPLLLPRRDHPFSQRCGEQQQATCPNGAVPGMPSFPGCLSFFFSLLTLAYLQVCQN